MKALILAAGIGTRLRPITDKIPKPLVPIADKPLLAYHFNHLSHHGITDILVNTHYLSAQIDSFINSYLETKASKPKIRTTYEENLLGSAGTLRENADFFNLDEEPFLVVYGDNLTDINYTRLIQQHISEKNLVTIASYYETHPEQKGIIEYDGSRRIKKFIEKPKPEQITSHYANAGIYVMNRQILPLLKSMHEIPLDFGHHVFPHLLEHNYKMAIYAMDETLLDIGNYENYTKAQLLPTTMNFDYTYGN